MYATCFGGIWTTLNHCYLARMREISQIIQTFLTQVQTGFR